MNTITGDYPAWQRRFPLVGRDADLSALRAALNEATPIIFLHGMSGTGKSRLAAEIVSTNYFPNGVIWFTATPNSTVEQLDTLLINHLRSSKEGLYSALPNVLIVLDGAEALSDPIPFIERFNTLPDDSPARILITTRVRWSMAHWSRVQTLMPLTQAAQGQVFSAMHAYLKPNHSLLEHKAELLALTFGRPKLLWYALNWADTYPPRYVLESLQTLRSSDARAACNDLLYGTLRVASRHPAWAMLQQAIPKLAACRTFTFETARELLNNDPTPLRHLRDLGLLSMQDGRYALDPLLGVLIGTTETDLRTHYEHYLQHAKDIISKQDYGALRDELPNLKDMFHWALDHAEPEAAVRFAEACLPGLAALGEAPVAVAWFRDVQTRTGSTLEGRLTALQADVANGLASALIAAREQDPASLREALELYQAALGFAASARDFDLSAQLNHNMAIAYRNLAEQDRRLENLLCAAQAIEQALRHYNPNEAPYETGAVQHTYGTILMQLAEHTNRTENLWSARNAFRKALALLSAERFPADAAAIYNNLGILYASTADNEDDPAKRDDQLNRAITALQKAGEYVNEHNTPLHYARTYTNLGHTYRIVASTSRNPDYNRSALTAYNRALPLWEAHNLHAAAALTHIGIAHAYMDLADQESDPDNLHEAAAHFSQTLTFYTPRRQPAEHYKIHVLLGTIQYRLGNANEAQNHWMQAERYFRQTNMTELADRVSGWLAQQTPPAEPSRVARWLRRTG